MATSDLLSIKDMTKPDNYGKPWTRDELIQAFDLYCRIPFKKTKASNPDVEALAAHLRRSPGSIARKLGNFGAFDPELRRRGISGLPHASKLDREVGDEFHSDWGEAVSQAESLRQSPAALPLHETALIPPSGPSEAVREAKQRVHQTFFRNAVLSSYENTCCVTGLRVSECLVAGHIVPWGEDERYRADPTNGLCLSATFHRLFDAGLVAISDSLNVLVAQRLVGSGCKATEELVEVYNNRPIMRPTRFLPSLEHLAWHRSNVFGR